ncbi:hypothetical protein Q5752_006981 [Cryptotrichosporon argae]
MDDPNVPGRLQVEAEADWVRVQGNASAALRASLESRLSLLPGGKEGEAALRLRPELEARVKELEATMWVAAKPNLIVNGFPYEDYVEATEPWDEALDRRVGAMYEERVGWDSLVASARKHTPRDVVAAEADLEDKRGAAEWRAEGDVGGVAAISAPAEIPKPPRHDEVIGTLAQVAADLSALSAYAPQQLSRVQRAQAVKDEIASLPA